MDVLLHQQTRPSAIGLRCFRGFFRGLFVFPRLWGAEVPRCELGTLWNLLFHALLNVHTP